MYLLYKKYLFKFILFISFFNIQIFTLYNIEFNLGLINFSNDIKHDFINNIYEIKLYFNLSIGNPIQIIPVILNKNTNDFYISNNYFYINNSYTCKFDNSTYIYFNEGYYAKDYLYLNESYSKEIDFIISENNYNISGAVGLDIPNNLPYRALTFLQTLKNADILNNKVWSIIINNNFFINDFNLTRIDNIGKFVIYEKEKFTKEKDNYLFISAGIQYSQLKWIIRFNDILIFNNNSYTKINELNFVDVRPDINYILTTGEYQKFIINYFFQKYIDKNICKMIHVKYHPLYKYIKCEKVKEFQIEFFPELIFKHNELQFNFSLNYKDLFVEDKINKVYYFLVLFFQHYRDSWLLGVPFAKKYTFIYDEDNKLIGFKKPKKIINKGTIIPKFIKMFMYIFLSLILIFIGMFLHKKIFGTKRRIKANELKDNYEYFSENKQTNNKMIKLYTQ